MPSTTTAATSLTSPVERGGHVVLHLVLQLGIEHVAQGVGNKTRLYEELRASIRFTDDEACFVGDDLPDLGPMTRVAFPVAVADAADEVKRRAAHVTALRGGRGAVRETIEMILRAQGKWDAIVRAFEAGER